MEAEEDGVPDPLHLEGFFPCPCPLNATMTNDTLIPVPDYAEAQDQYMQIDDLTKRIDILTNACKVRGVYDAAAQGVKRVFEEGQEPDLIPIDSWAMFAEKGGLKGAMDWVPIGGHCQDPSNPDRSPHSDHAGFGPCDRHERHHPWHIGRSGNNGRRPVKAEQHEWPLAGTPGRNGAVL